jgi:hypothetical protein
MEPGSCTGHNSGHGRRLLGIFQLPLLSFALQFKAEHDETLRELEDVSKKAGIAELEWEHQRKQLLETIDGKSLDLF